MDYTKYKEWLKVNLDPERYEHSLGVAECAEELAERFGLDKEKEYHSFNHSACGEEEYIQKKVREYGLDEDEAEDYAEVTRDRLKLKYIGGTLGQGVIFMSDEQFDDLCTRLSLEEIHKYFDIVAECEKNGKRYKKKSHYQAILDMVQKDRGIKI